MSYRFRLGPCRFLMRVGYQGNRVAERTRAGWRCRAAHREDVCVCPSAALAVELRAAGLQVGSCRAKYIGVRPGRPVMEWTLCACELEHPIVRMGISVIGPHGRRATVEPWGNGADPYPPEEGSCDADFPRSSSRHWRCA